MKALLLIDIQNDFLPTGALPVPEGDRVVAVANRVMPRFEVVIATQDWHPAGHGSFAANHAGRKVGEEMMLAGQRQILWPVHCVQGTPGAEFAPGLERGRIAHVTRKGMDAAIDSYSGFFDNGHRAATDLDAFLRSRGVKEIFLMGLATDYCVKFTALDARKLGYEVKLIEDGCRGVNLQKGDVERAIAEMRAAGVEVVESTETLAGPSDSTIYFYRVSDDYGCFSNFAPYAIRMDDKLWPTTEHYFQAQKFEDAEARESVRMTKSPMIAARMGRDRKKKLRQDWESTKVAIMMDAVRAKFSQHESIRAILLATEDATLVEHTEGDSYWGDGGDGSGKNILGMILMRIRNELREQPIQD